MQYGTVEFVQHWDLLFTVGCRPELLGWSDQVFGQQRQRQRQRAENQELRHCQARAQVRAVAPDDQTVFCLTNNSYNSREPSGGRSWSWWRSWRVLVSTVQSSHFSCTGPTVWPVTPPVRARSINIKTRWWLHWICRIRDTAMQVGALSHGLLRSHSARRPESLII